MTITSESASTQEPGSTVDSASPKKIPVWGILLLIAFSILVIAVPIIIYYSTDKKSGCRNRATHIAEGDAHYIKLDHDSCSHSDILASHSSYGAVADEDVRKLYQTVQTTVKTKKRYAVALEGTPESEESTESTGASSDFSILEETETGKEIQVEVLLSERLVAITFDQGYAVEDEGLHSVELEMDTVRQPELKKMFGPAERSSDVGTVAGYWKMDGVNHEVQIQVDHAHQKFILLVSVSSNNVNYVSNTLNELNVVTGAQFIYRI